MEENKVSSSQYDLFSGILFAVLALGALRGLILSFSFSSLLLSAGYLLISAMLFIKQKDITISISFAIVALSDIIGFINFHGFMNKFTLIMSAAAYAFMAFVALAIYTNYLPKYKKSFNNIFFIPIILIAASVLFAFINAVVLLFKGVGAAFLLRSLLYGVAEVVAVVIFCKMIVFPNGVPKKMINISYDDADSEYTSSILPKEAFCDMAKHVLLLLFTFGIWNLIWVYKVTGYLNVVKDEEPRNPTTKLLLYMFVPFYSIYWVYKSAQRIDKLAKQKGLSGDSATLCLIMAIFVPIIAPIIMQDKMNNIITAKKTAATYQQSEVNMGAAGELKNYKDLLDSGVITEEEFEAKKKQLLGL